MHKLLVVDDEADVCDFVKSFFEDRGYRVLTALNGTEAVSLVERERPELTLLDIKMKGMDGLETLRQIREVDPDAKVIMVTALDEQEKIEEAYRCGAMGYITKPLVLDHLEDTVMKNLGIRNGRDRERVP